MSRRPRRPCSRVDATFGKTFSANGVRAHAARHGLAGAFCRVLEPGTLRARDLLVVVERPHPEYTLEKVSRKLYGMDGAAVPGYKIPGPRRTDSTPCNSRKRVRDVWAGTAAELKALASLPELADLEWRNEFKVLCEGYAES